MNKIRIGTCSWKYESWEGIVYPEFGDYDFLEEYSKKYNTVEIDQWFWSLHPNDKITLPKNNVVHEYNNATPNDFRFTIKIPNSITLTHPYKSKNRNTHFLSIELMNRFLESIEPISSKVGILMFQFEYLNKQKMASQLEFQLGLEIFFSELDRNYDYGIEIRNPNYLNKSWFKFLENHQINPVFLQGYYMPNIYDTYKVAKEFIKEKAVIRLHGFDRKGIEQRTNSIWNEIVEPQDADLIKIVEMINSLTENKIDLYLNVNNHYEGSAPLTIEKIKKMLSV
jgi:uncharacterized protein YecE (DUF72 family)